MKKKHPGQDRDLLEKSEMLETSRKSFDEAVSRLWTLGLSRVEIGLRLGVSRQKVSYRLKKMQLIKTSTPRRGGEFSGLPGGTRHTKVKFDDDFINRDER